VRETTLRSRHQCKDSPAAHEDCGEADCLLQPMVVHGGADIHLQPREVLMPEKVGAPEEGCDPVGSPRWSRLLAGPMAPWRERSPRWSRFSGRAGGPVGDPRWSSLFLKDCTLWEGPTLGQFVEDCLPWEGPQAGAGAECEESSPGGGRSSRESMW